MNKFVGGALAGSVAFWILPTLPAFVLMGGLAAYLAKTAREN